MGGEAFLVAHSLIFLVFLVVGILAMFLPQETYSRALGHLWPTGHLDRTGLGLQRRIVGVVLALMGIYALARDIPSIYDLSLKRQGPQTPKGGFVAVNPTWFPFVMGLLVVCVGFFMALNAEAVVRWTKGTLFPGRQISQGTLRAWRVVFRITGVLMIYSSAGLFSLWLRG